MEDKPIDFKTAILAKDKGFKSPTLHYYFEDGVFIENSFKDTVGMDYGAEYEVEFSELIENWNDDYVTKKDGSRCFGCRKSNVYFETYSAPTQSELLKWLRELYKIDVIPTMSEFSRTYGYKIFHIENGKTVVINNCFSKNEKIEDVLDQGLLEGLKLIN